MKVLVIAFFLFKSCVAFNLSSNIEELRHLYISATSEEEVCQELYHLTENSDLNTNVIAYSYHAVANMLLAKYYRNPIKKWRYFNTGKSMLESAVRQYPNNLELRFLRYTVQKNAPDFLLYNSDLKSDKEFITNNIDYQTEHLRVFINRILNTL